jgi:hypothetical protein
MELVAPEEISRRKGSPMQRSSVLVASVCLLLAGIAQPAFAEVVIRSGTIPAGTPLTGGRPSSGGNCSSLSGNVYYFATTQFQAPTTGTWRYVDLLYAKGTGDLWVSFYSGTFDPTSPLTNCMADFDDGGAVNLTAGVTYTVMVSTNGIAGTGPYRLALVDDAPITGNLASGQVLTPGRPNGTQNSCPLTTGTYYYQLSEFKPAISGDYYYSDSGYRDSTGVDINIAFYTGGIGSFDPATPAGNGCFTTADDIFAIPLVAGTTYTILVSNHSQSTAGDFNYLLFTDTAAPIPTLGTWGFAALGLLLCVLGVLGVRAARRRRGSPSAALAS